MFFSFPFTLCFFSFTFCLSYRHGYRWARSKPNLLIVKSKVDKKVKEVNVEAKVDEILKYEIQSKIKFTSKSFLHTNSSRGNSTRSPGLGAAISKEIVNCFQKPESPETLLLKVLQDRRKDINNIHIVTILQKCAKEKVDVTKIVSLQEIEEFLKRPSNRPLQATEASSLLYGLRLLSPTTPYIRNFLSTITLILLECKGKFQPKDIGSSFYGLQQFSNLPETIDLLTVLLPKIYQSDTNFNSHDLCSTFFGLKGFHDCIEYRAVLKAITEKFAQTNESINSLAIGNAILSVNNMNADIVEVQQLLEVAVEKINLLPTNETIPYKTFGSILFGLRSMSANNDAVRNILRVITKKLNESHISYLPGDCISSMLTGLRCMTADNEEVKDFLRVLTNKLKYSKCELLEVGSLSRALYGLRYMKSNIAEVRDLIEAISRLIPDVSKAKTQMSAIHIANSLYGCQSMSEESPQVRNLFSKLILYIEASHDLNWKDIDLSQALYGLQSASSSASETLGLLKALLPKIKASEATLSPRAFGMAMYGMRGMSSSHPVVTEILVELTKRIRGLDAQSISNSLYALKSMDSNSDEVCSMLHAVIFYLSGVPLLFFIIL